MRSTQRQSSLTKRVEDELGLVAVHAFGPKRIWPAGLMPNYGWPVYVGISSAPKRQVAEFKRNYWYEEESYFCYWFAGRALKSRLLANIKRHLDVYDLDSTEEGEKLRGNWHAILPEEMEHQLVRAAKEEGISLLTDLEKSVLVEREVQKHYKRVAGM